jgi:hypothetical protein
MAQRPTIDAPETPQQGAQLFTLGRRAYGPDSYPCSNLWPLGDCFRIHQVNSRSFYWRASKARAGRRLLVEWRQWLSELQRQHHVWLLKHERDPAGWSLLRPLQPDLSAMAATLEGLDRFECDQRFQRAVRQVTDHYSLERVEGDEGEVVVTVRGGAQPYEVRVLPDGFEPPSCSCPDAIHRRPLHGGFCKHAVAVLLRWPDLRHQLLSAIL